MADDTDKNPAEQIRAEYVETLKRWYSSHEGCTTPACEGCDTTVESAVDALAEAGQLPTGIESRYIGRGMQRRWRYVGDWHDPRPGTGTSRDGGG